MKGVNFFFSRVLLKAKGIHAIYVNEKNKMYKNDEGGAADQKKRSAQFWRRLIKKRRKPPCCWLLLPLVDRLSIFVLNGFVVIDLILSITLDQRVEEAAVMEDDLDDTNVVLVAES